MRKVAQMNRMQWLAWRNLGLGASDACAVMGKSPWMSPFELWAQKARKATPQPQNVWMKRGLELEPLARDAYEQQTGIAMPAACGEFEEAPEIRASFDGLNSEVKRGLEIKCPGREDHLTARKGRIPEKYLWQCVHLLLVSGFHRLDYWSFDGTRGVLVPFERNPVLEAQLLGRELEFWRKHVVANVPPPTASDRPLDAAGIFKVRRVK